MEGTPTAVKRSYDAGDEHHTLRLAGCLTLCTLSVNAGEGEDRRKERRKERSRKEGNRW